MTTSPPRPLFRAARAAAVVAAAALLFTGCAAPANSTDATSTEPSVLRWAFSLPTSWDPVTSRTGNDINTISLAYASLTQIDADGKVLPALAESWDYNDEGTAVTFHLRPDLVFSDGTPLDAEAVKEFFERGKTQEDSFLRDQLATVDTVSADSETDVTLHLTGVDYQVPALVAGRTGAIASPTAAETDPEKLAAWPVGAGPFTITEFVPESHATFEKNPDYWDADDIHIDRFELTVAPDAATLVAGIQSGSFDVATLPASKIEEAEAAGLTVTVKPSLAVSDVSINANKAPFDDPKVVEAFRYAFDRQQFVDVITSGKGETTHQPFPKGNPAFNPEVEKLWDYDPEKAKALLKEAGYDEGELSIEITAASFSEQGAEIAQAQLAEIGVNSTISLVPPGSSTWQSEVYVAKNPQLAIDGTIGRETPVQNLLAVYGPQGIMNLSGPNASDEFLAALQKVRETPLDDASYSEVLQAAVKAGVEQSPTNYIYSSPWVIASSSSVSELNLLPSQFRWEGVTVGQ
ncbi:ABC transporter substrate-binding protein [Herbiconiux sp. KACC 21604]|uniref:ABC transporter substrate-binding protein n=1 Tax=unclassified Herbiconiux TaxID=2618217 RepID=UPI00149272AD|nr:ABC transporter substrate-binding protein [Herbiconiux sp. SALV-R1]QJU53898.1 peptide ABC transporter substrate-binding protein [Herbiconiux sp. SALV-R1]WPO84916.1 ABC transporter substrate-binding protein [Herbiconiux sp. KACC 21604]